MSRERFILTDVDGVLLDWTSAFRDFLLKNRVGLKTDYPQDWDLLSWIDQDAASITELILRFNRSNQFAKLKGFPDAQEILPKLQIKYQIVAITCCSSEPKVAKKRVQNLEQQFGFVFDQVHCLDLGQSKADCLKLYPSSVWIEDRFEGALEGSLHGHQALLINRDYNRQKEHPQIRRIDSWAEVQSVLKNRVK